MTPEPGPGPTRRMESPRTHSLFILRWSRAALAIPDRRAEDPANPSAFSAPAVRFASASSGNLRRFAASCVLNRAQLGPLAHTAAVTTRRAVNLKTSLPRFPSSSICEQTTSETKTGP